MNIAIYTNILTPYRIFFYDAVYKECQRNGDHFHVLLMADTEPDRNWAYDEYKKNYTILLKHKTITVAGAYIHFNSNLKGELEKLDLDVLICAGSYLCPGIWDVLRWKKEFGYTTYYWSESHLNEERNYGGMKIWIREKLRRSVYQRFEGFWYAGQMSLEFIKKYAGTESKLIFVPNLVEEEKYNYASLTTDAKRTELRKKYNVENDKTIFFCPARLSPVKGIDKFISILAKCPQKDKTVVLVAGDGELKERIEAEATSKGVNLRLLGFQNQKTVVELYSLADIFLMPSLSDPNPLTCVEALWAGLPLFISEHCGNYPEVIREGKNGYVFSYQDEKTAIRKLSYIINSNAEWRKEARELSLLTARDMYCTNRVVSGLLAELHR